MTNRFESQTYHEKESIIQLTLHMLSFWLRN